MCDGPQDPLLDAFEHRARGREGEPLAIGERGAATAAEIAAMAGSLGGRLRAAGVEPGAVVALALADGPAFLAGLVASLRARAVPALLDPWSPPLERRRAAGVLGAAALLECADGWPSAAEEFSVEPCRGSARHEENAVIKLTSGSTGMPRGVLTPTAALAADDAQLRAAMGLTDRDRLLASVPLGHSYGLSSLAVPALRRGMTLVFPRPRDPFAALAAAAQFGATFFATTPAWVHAFVRLGAPPRWPESLRLTISAGSALAPETARRFREASGRSVHTFYGSSECGGICYDAEGGAAERGTVGPPVPGVEVDLAEDAVVRVRSAAVARGYLPDPEARLCDGVFVTSDVGAWRGSELALLGRADELLNVHGRKVVPREVEDVLRELAGVDEAVVVGIPAEGTGGHDVRAFVACAPGRLTAAEVLAHCRARLTPHKVPRGVVLLREVPRTPRGKIDRAALAAAPRDPA